MLQISLQSFFDFLFRLQVLSFVVFADFFLRVSFKAGLYIELYLMSNNDSLGQIVMKLIFYDFKVAALMATFYDSRDPWAQTESIGADPKLGPTQF